MSDSPSKPPARPRRLGRGLAALVDQASTAVRDSQAAISLPDVASLSTGTDTATDQSSALADSSGSDDRFVRISLGSLEISPFQPRESMSDEALDELADSIKRSGVIQPIVVRAKGDGYELIAGERRWRAAARAGLDTIPAIVREVDDRTAAEWALVENIQRADLNPVERARAFHRLVDEFGMTHTEIAESAGIKRPTVANAIRLLDLGDELLELLAQGELSAGHAKALLSIEDGARRAELGRRCAAEGMSVRELEQRARHTPGSGTPSKGDASAPASARSRAERDLETRLGEHLGTRVSVRTNSGGSKGKLVIEFYSLDHFDDLIARLGLEPS
ncbi:MAG: ParB/RepB/Spo0J family partition protein [Phycisphaerales bacterium]